MLILVEMFHDIGQCLGMCRWDERCSNRRFIHFLCWFAYEHWLLVQFTPAKRNTCFIAEIKKTLSQLRTYQYSNMFYAELQTTNCMKGCLILLSVVLKVLLTFVSYRFKVIAGKTTSLDIMPEDSRRCCTGPCLHSSSISTCPWKHQIF